MERYDPCLCGRLRRASRTLTRHYDEALQPAGMTVNQFSILRTLSRMEAPTLTDLSEETSHEKSGLWRTLQPMIRDGLIATTASGRAQKVSLTEDGLTALARALPLWREAQQQIERGIGLRARVLLDILEDVETRV